MDDLESGRAPPGQLDPDGAPTTGSSEPVGALFRGYRRWLLGHLRSLYGDEQAEDLVQDAFLRAARYAARGQTILRPQALLLKIARNLAVSGARRSDQRVSQASVTLSETEHVLRDPAQQDAAVLLKQVILGLPEPLRDVFVLNRFYGLTYGEIAARRGLSVKTVEWRMSQALARCAGVMAEAGQRNAEISGRRDQRNR